MKASYVLVKAKLRSKLATEDTQSLHFSTWRTPSTYTPLEFDAGEGVENTQEVSKRAQTKSVCLVVFLLR